VSKERRTRKSKSRSRSRSREKPAKLVTRKPVTSEEFIDPTEEEAEVMKLMGFGTFDSTKGKHVQGNEEPMHGTVQVVLKRKYRQYMNRKGGFNRPLDPIA
jgi:U4/U6.U5 tri-snRNP-associated protein 3